MSVMPAMGAPGPIRSLLTVVDQSGPTMRNCASRS